MKKKSHKPYLDADTGILYVDGKKYITSITRNKKIDGITHADKLLFKEFDEEGFNKKIEYIKNKIINQLTTDELVVQLLKKLPNSEIDKAYKDLKKGDKPSKQSGCLGFKIGSKFYLELIGGAVD